MINQNSNSHRIMEYFCENCEIVLFLSATPMQLGSKDLYSLLNLLNPSEFIDERIFNLMIQPNQYINSAIRYIRKTCDENWQKAAVNELKQVCINDWARSVFSNNHQLNYWINRLDDKENLLTQEERIACLRDLESLHTLSHIVNRTKRKDIGEFTIREPITIKTEYNNNEQAFYDEVKSFKKSILMLKYGFLITNLIMSTIERQITSCIPAFVCLLDDFIKTGLFSLMEITDDIEIDKTEIDLKDLDFHNQAIRLKRLAYQLPKYDSKTEKLIQIINETKESSNDGKLLVFSFFKHTLRYLLKEIQKSDIRVELITGDTKTDDRDVIRNRFRLHKDEIDAIDVLLCSEVGCEGLDYEFCSRMVNYDIPWNPMKIEQRIGRIDRFGQKSPKVQIYNFITAGTVEERVFFRCYERLGIFNATMGDLEAVLGNVVSDITQTAFDINLTDEQKAQRAKQIADNILRLAIEQRKFESDSKELFLIDIEQKDKSIIVEKEIQIILHQKLIQYFIKSQFPSAICTITKDKSLKLKLFKLDKQVLLNQLIQKKRKRIVDKNSKDVQLFEKYLLSDSQVIPLVFECDDKIDKLKSLFISVNHPLLLMALESIHANCDICLTSFYVNTNYLPKGNYIFACYEWYEIGYRQSKDIKIIAQDLTNGKEYSIGTTDFEQLIIGAYQTDFPNDIQISNNLNELIFKEQRKAKYKLSEINDDTVNRKLSTLEKYYSNQIEKTKYDLENATNEKIRIMHKSRINRLNMIWEEKRLKLTDKLIADITIKQFAGGYMEVK